MTYTVSQPDPLQLCCTLQQRSLEVRLELSQAEAARDDAICQAAMLGFSHARIAEATGLTRSRVGQIALGVSHA